MDEVLISGKSSFKIEVPYKLISTGEVQKKPLIVYLHGFGQNIDQFQEKIRELLKFEAYHLFIQGPYPLYDRSREGKVEYWGRAWYLYDGEQTQFIKSMELSSEFIQEVVDGILNHIDASRICLFGYSMGAYLAGYFALSRWKHVNELVMIGGRLKTEVYKDREHHYDHMNVLALHGSRDESVKSDPQKESVEEFEGWGANVSFREVDEAHPLTKKYIEEVSEWFDKQGYKRI